MKGETTDPSAPGADLTQLETDVDSDNDKAPSHRPGIFYRMFHSKRKVRDAVEKWRLSRDNSLRRLLPKIDFTPKVVVNELGDSSVNLSARAWVKTGDYWNVFYDLNERIYTELPKAAGISFPFPQMDVHVNNN